MEIKHEKLHIDGILESFDFESIDACENFSEMIETLFVGQRRMTTNLLDIVHIDVYSPLCVVECGGSFNFIYFNQRFEWIFYIYLMRKSIKYLKKFKYFQDEVKNHCNKKILNL